MTASAPTPNEHGHDTPDGQPADAPSPGRGSVLILGSYPPPFGGISTHLESFAPYLRGKGYGVTVVSPGSSRTVEEHDGFRVQRMTKDRKANLLSLLPRSAGVASDFARTRFVSRRFLEAEAIRAAAEPHAPEASLICAYHLVPWGFAGALLAEAYGVPLIVVNFGEFYSEPGFYRRYRRQISYIESRATKMMSVSSHCGRTLAHLGIKRDVELIRLGIDVVRFHPGVDPSPVRRKLAIAEDDRIVLFLGRMIPDMGLHTLLAAVPNIADRAVTIIAGGRGELTEAANSLAAELPGRVFVTTDLPYDELPSYYRAADVVVAPSRDNRSCCGLAIKEAMATGRPIVASSVGGVPEVVRDGETGLLVDPESDVALAGAIRRLLDDEELRTAMGAAGRARALELFDMRSTHVHMERVFGETMAPASRPARPPVTTPGSRTITRR